MFIGMIMFGISLISILITFVCLYFYFQAKRSEWTAKFLDQGNQIQFYLKRISELELEVMAHKETLANKLNYITQLSSEKAKIETELAFAIKHSEQQQEMMEHTQERMQNAFKALSAEALRSNNQSFLEIAQHTFSRYQENVQLDWNQKQDTLGMTLNPIKELMTSFDQKVQELEKQRLTAYTSLTEQIKHLGNAHVRLETETAGLNRALRAPNVRGRWGELQLKRTVEIAGMVEYVDFFEQETFATDDGRQRPDMVIHLPNQLKVVVDAKAPIIAYLEALETKEEMVHKQKLQLHARLLRDHILKLGSKQYWKQLEYTPEFVVLFLPGEVFFSAALEQDPTLIELGIQNNVILSMPTTLISLLKIVSYGWHQEKSNKDTKAITNLGRELYERILVLSEHLNDLRKSLTRTVEAYNKTSRSIETRVLTTVRKLKDLHGAMPQQEIPILDSVETVPVSSSFIENPQL
jgi:DNA recombination protein RmuC